VMTIPTIRVELGSAYAELSLMAALLAALACGLSADQRRPWLLTACGAGLGVSAATKLPMYAISAVALAFLIGPRLFAATRQQRRAALMGLAAYLIVLAPWLMSAARDTGAPLSPAPVSMAGQTLGIAPPEVRWFMDRAQESGSGALRELTTLAKIFAPPIRRREQLGILSILPALLLIAIAPGAIRRRWNHSMAAALAVALTTVAVFYAPSFSAVRTHWPYSSSRFLLTAVVPLTAVAVASVTRRRPVFTWTLLICATFNFAMYSTYGATWRSAAPAMGLLVLGICVVAALTRGRSHMSPAGAWLLVLLAATLGLTALHTLRDRLRADLMAHEFTVGAFQTAWTRALPYVDDPRTSLRIAVTSGPFQNMDNWTVYPFMGRRLQNEVVYVPPSLDGLIPPFDGWDAPGLARTADKRVWLARLETRGVTHVVSFNPPSIELSWMEADADRFEWLEGSKGIWGLFRIR
jgi:hypothetical protein